MTEPAGATVGFAGLGRVAAVRAADEILGRAGERGLDYGDFSSVAQVIRTGEATRST